MYLEFEKYLQSKKISTKSIRNYKSDISHFFSWAKGCLKELGTYVEDVTEITPFLNYDFAAKYLSHMADSKLPRKTVNRRLSTLRHLSRFLISTALTDTDFMAGIQNITDDQMIKPNNLINHPSVSEFKAFLEAEKASPNTIKNYISDIRQFLTWLENNHARFT